MGSVLTIQGFADVIKAKAEKRQGWEQAETVGMPSIGLSFCYYKDQDSFPNCISLVVSRMTSIIYEEPRDFEAYLFEALKAFFGNNWVHLLVEPPRAPSSVASRMYEFHLLVKDDWVTPIPVEMAPEPYYLVDEYFLAMEAA